jgi:hypothetical protein
MTKVLSIRQPWAWLIAVGLKDVENRDWPTKFRGQFLVHAAKRVPSESELRQIELTQGVVIDRAALRFGGIVGCTRLVDCVTFHRSKWFSGSYGFVLADSKPLPFTPLLGKLGFFRLPEHVTIY